MDGGTNDSGNPGTYTSRTETIVLKNAVKDGYTFSGWYLDAAFQEKVMEITKGSRGNITLYAKWRVKEYSFPNLEQTYTALDGTTLHSKADGKPKVLIFYYDDRSDTAKNTIQSVRDHIDDFDRADIYIIECSSATKDNVSKFQKLYGCDQLLFAYDETKDVNTIKMSEYTEAAGIPGGTDVLLPIICYIDENNYFQMMTQGESSAEQYYTGKALKPAVSVYDGDTLLAFFYRDFFFHPIGNLRGILPESQYGCAQKLYFRVPFFYMNR